MNSGVMYQDNGELNLTYSKVDSRDILAPSYSHCIMSTEEDVVTHYLPQRAYDIECLNKKILKSVSNIKTLHNSIIYI